MAKGNPDYLKDADHLLSAKQMMAQYWDRPSGSLAVIEANADIEAVSLQRIADLWEILTEAAVSVAESQHQIATGERARK